MFAHPVVVPAPPLQPVVPVSPDEARDDQILHIPLDRIRPNPHQPRQQFDEPALQRLADSIRHDGLMQPVVVRPLRPEVDGGVAYELVVGERRWRAAKLAGLSDLPATVRELDDRQLAAWALVENLQREDLNPIERASAFQQLIQQFQLSHEEVAQRVGVERPTITNSLRLLAMAPQVQEWVRQGHITNGQAKALAAISDLDQQVAIARKAIDEGWSVRHTEQAVRELEAVPAAQADGDPAPVADQPGSLSQSGRNAHLADLEQRIAHSLSTRVRVKPGRKKGSGSLTIQFYSFEHFEGLMSRMGVSLE
jgi:ParB family chromosome partitioning protein